MNEIAYLVSVALAHAVTNIDNLAMLLILAPLQGLRRAAAAYVVSQVIIGLAALAFAVGIFSLIGTWTGWLGIFPIMFGAYALLSGPDTAPDGASTGIKFGGTVVLFLSIGIDTFALMTPLLGDTRAVFLPAALIGMGLSILAICAGAMVLSRATGMSERLTGGLARLVPFVMIAAGLYVLLDTPTDVI